MKDERLPPEVARNLLFSVANTGQPPPGLVRHFTVGFDKTLSSVEEDLLDGILPAGYGAVRMIIGRNGNGKSHLCRDIVERALARGFATAEIDLTTERELAKPEELYRVIASHVRLDACDGTRALHGIDNILFSKELVPRDWCAARVDAAYLRVATHLVAHSGSAEEVEAYSMWIRGESLSKLDRQALHLKAGLSARNAMAWLRNLILVLQMAGAKGAVVVLDEAETIMDAVRSRLRKRLPIMLDLINGAASREFPGTLFVLTGVTMGADVGWDHLKPVQQRLWPDLPFPDGANPRGARILVDGTGEVDEPEWMQIVARRILEFAQTAGFEVDAAKEAELGAAIERQNRSPMALNKRTFVREAASIAIYQ